MNQSKDLLIEVGTEELPPLALKGLSTAFAENVSQQLSDNNLSHHQVNIYATPRRLAVLIIGVDRAQPQSKQQKLGPALQAAFDANGKPTRAAEGFARSCGVTVDDLQEIETDKGLRLGLETIVQGKDTVELLPEIIKSSLQQLPIPKAMRWGNLNESFIRPVKWLVCLYGNTTIPLNLYGCQSSNLSRGHRFMSSGDIKLNQASDYVAALEKAFVMVDQSKRMNRITEQVRELANTVNAKAIIDEHLLEEVSALVEWPVALIGNFDERFLQAPQEALISTMSKNQKYFHLVDDDGALIAKFITISNLESKNPQAIIKGNEKVIRPRLADAMFFYEQDCKHSLSSYSKKLKTVVFQNQLGTLFDKSQRISAIAVKLAETIGADIDMVQTAALLCKADLVTDMVNEFPSLQGTMGKYYARVQGYQPEVCGALEEIYLPRTSADTLPQTKTGLCLALADRIDNLVGIVGIGQGPTGSKDPFALRRAAIGTLNILIGHQLNLDLKDLILWGIDAHIENTLSADTSTEVLAFLIGRMHALYQDQGVSQQVFNSARETGVTKPYDLHLRIKAVAEFDKSLNSDTLAEANKRVANILSKNQSDTVIGAVDTTLLQEAEEVALYEAIKSNQKQIESSCQAQDYGAALEKLTSMKPEIDGFFDKVMVMSEDDRVRNNRLNLLFILRKLFVSVADISQLQR